MYLVKKGLNCEKVTVTLYIYIYIVYLFMDGWMDGCNP